MFKKLVLLLMCVFCFKVQALGSEFGAINALNKDIPNLNSLNFSYGLEPGKTLEDDFKQKYAFLIPSKINNEFESVYILDTKYLTPASDYKKVVLVFQNGLLNTLSLYPKDADVNKILTLYGNQMKIRPATNSYCFYEYSNFILLVDTKDKKIKSIGIISSI